MKQILAVYDAKAEAYTHPIFCIAVGEGIRSFEDEVNNPQSPFHKHPEDYTIFHLGQYDELTAMFDLKTAPLSLGGALNFKKEV